MATITDLPYELLSYIMIMVVQSPDGGDNLARAVSVCREFFKFAEDVHILKVVAFDNVRLSNRDHLFQKINGLVNKCAQAGNIAAQFLLAKIILLSSSNLFLVQVEKSGLYSRYDKHAVLKLIGLEDPKDGAPVDTFVTHFLPDQASTSRAPQKRLVHYQLVTLFLRQCGLRELREMSFHLSWYMKYFTGSDNIGSRLLQATIHSMRCAAIRIGSREQLREIKESFDYSVRALREIETTANEDDPSWQKARAEASSRCRAIRIVLQFKCEEARVDCERLFGHQDNGEAFKTYFEEVRNKFEQCRSAAIIAFEMNCPSKWSDRHA